MGSQEERREKLMSEGSIESMVLTNFMCHANLEVKLCPGVNFIVGENGSGKSAILTGLCVALGARAKSTNRSETGNKGLVKTGASTARVVVRLRNAGDDAYRPDEFGPTIVLERTINGATGASTLKVRSSSGKEVACKKADLERLVDHFNIDIENPVNVMTQDASRAFLQSQNAKDKYNFFVKATLLAEIQESLGFVQEKVGVMQALIAAKEAELPGADARRRALEEELSSFEALTRLEERRAALQSKHAWAVACEAEAAAKEAAEAAAAQRDEVLPACARKLAKRRAMLDEANGAREEAAKALEAFTASIPAAADGRRAALAADAAARRDSAAAARRAADAAGAAAQLRGRAAQLEASAAAERGRARDTAAAATQATQGEARAAAAEVARCAEALERAREAHAAARAAEADAAAAASRLRAAADEEQARAEAAGRDQRDAEAAARQAAAARTNSLVLFGPTMPALVADLRGGGGPAGRFAAPPVGPLGALVRLSDPAWAVAAEEIVGPVLDTFLVATKDDGFAVRAAAARLGNHGQPVVVTNRIAAPAEYPIRPPPGLRHPTLHCLLTCPPPGPACVVNALVDQCAMERAALVPDIAAARSALESVAGIDEAYTADGYRHQGRGPASFRSVSAQRARAGRDPRLGRDAAGAAAAAAAVARAAAAARAKAEAEGRWAAADAAARAADVAARNRSASTAAKLAVNAALSDHQEAVRAARAADAGGGGGGAGGGAAAAAAAETAEETADALDAAAAEARRAAAGAAAAAAAADADAAAARGRAAQAAAAAAEKQGAADAVRAEAEALQAAMAEAAGRAAAAAAQVARYEELGAKFAEEGERLGAEARAKAAAAALHAANAAVLCTRAAADAIEGPDESAKLAAAVKVAEARVARERAAAKRPLAAVEAELDDARACAKRLRRALACAREPCVRMAAMAAARSNMLRESSRHIREQVSHAFNIHLQTRGHAGRVEVSFKDNTCELSVQMGGGAGGGGGGGGGGEGGGAKRQKVKDLSQLSGGERSFTTLCFTLALNESTESPFCALDEWDVFMDSVHRKVALDKMLDFAAKRPERQFILITPQDVSTVKPSATVTIQRLQAARP